MVEKILTAFSDPAHFNTTNVARTGQAMRLNWFDDKQHMTSRWEICTIFMVDLFHRTLRNEVFLRLVCITVYANKSHASI